MLRRMPPDSGFTLAEVLIAMVVLSTAAVASSGLFVIAVQSRLAARNQTWATMIATDKLEQLRGLSWTVDDLRPSPSDSLTRDASGYVDYLDAAGRWVGSRSMPPAGAVWVRRWSVQALPADLRNTLIIQVFVAPIVARRAVTSASGTARVITLRTRKAP